MFRNKEILCRSIGDSQMDFQKPVPDPAVPYQNMYVTLFKAVTAALYMMEDGEFMKARAALVRAQQKTEQLYMERQE